MRRYWPLVIGGVLAWGTLGLAFYVAFPPPPPPCADDINFARARTLLVSELIETGKSSADVLGLEVTVVEKLPDEAWPTYSVAAQFTKNGKTRTITATGNGCGLSDLFETSITIRRLPDSSV